MKASAEETVSQAKAVLAKGRRKAFVAVREQGVYLYEHSQYVGSRVTEQVLYPLYRQHAELHCAESLEQVRLALQANRGVLGVKYEPKSVSERELDLLRRLLECL